jgi:CDP-diacylglycerol---glycerol-3-phosphate 3-phosphatidyltransferase
MNLPNRITFARVGTAVLMILIYSLSFLPQASTFAPNLGTTGFNWIDLVCAALFVLGSITDSLDGKIARKKNLVTDLGKFLDPLADKFLVDSALILLATKIVNGNYLLYPFLVVLFICRDLAVDGLRMLTASQGQVMAANIYGKIKTVAQMIIIPVIFLNGFPFNYLDFQGQGNFAGTYIITNVLASLALACSLISAGIYFVQSKDSLKKGK